MYPDNIIILKRSIVLTLCADNQEAWESLADMVGELTGKLDLADIELEEARLVNLEIHLNTLDNNDISQLYVPSDSRRLKDQEDKRTKAATVRKDILEAFNNVVDTNNVAASLANKEKKEELDRPITERRERCKVSDKMDKRLDEIDEIYPKLKTYIDKIKDLESFCRGGQRRMEELLTPQEPLSADEKVMLTMELSEDIKDALQEHENQEVSCSLAFENILTHVTLTESVDLRSPTSKRKPQGPRLKVSGL